MKLTKNQKEDLLDQINEDLRTYPTLDEIETWQIPHVISLLEIKYKLEKELYAPLGTGVLTITK